MKTSVDIPDALLDQLRERAEARNTTIKALLSDAIRKYLKADSEREPFKLRDASFPGGFGPDVDITNRDQMIEVIYGERY